MNNEPSRWPELAQRFGLTLNAGTGGNCSAHVFDGRPHGGELLITDGDGRAPEGPECEIVVYDDDPLIEWTHVATCASWEEVEEALLRCFPIV
jgi:hypothetical protein